MGFTINYRSTQPVSLAESMAIQRAINAACHGRTWLSCEPVNLLWGDDGYLLGGSKPNFQPHPDDVASAAREGLPDGTIRDMLDVLCQLSRDHGIDWEIHHNQSGGPVGYIRAGVCDADVLAVGEVFADLCEFLAGEMDGLPDKDLN